MSPHRPQSRSTRGAYLTTGHRIKGNEDRFRVCNYTDRDNVCSLPSLMEKRTRGKDNQKDNAIAEMNTKRILIVLFPFSRAKVTNLFKVVRKPSLNEVFSFRCRIMMDESCLSLAISAYITSYRLERAMMRAARESIWNFIFRRKIFF